MNYKTLLVIVFGVLAFAYVPLLIAAQVDSSTVLSAVTGLSTQISTVEDNILSKLTSMDKEIADLQMAAGSTGTTVQATVNSLAPLLYATIGLVVITLVLTLVNLFLLMRRGSAPKEAEKPKETEKTK